jgi:hypothetical protein
MTAADHPIDCGFHLDQYPDECTCGAIKPNVIVTYLCDPAHIETLERHAQRISHELTCRAVTHKTIEEDKLALLDVINAVLEIARQRKA